MPIFGVALFGVTTVDEKMFTRLIFRDLAEKYQTKLQSCSISRYGNTISFIKNGIVDPNYSKWVTLRNATSNRQAEFDWTAFAPSDVSNSA